jgi:hypothetical protein
MIGKVFVATALLAAGVLPSTGAERGQRYVNPRFGYAITIPPSFGPIREAENGDGGVAQSPLGHAELAAWGANLSERGFRDEAAFRRADDRNEGWRITYIRTTPTFAVLSGTRNGRIAYQRGMPGCDGQAVFYRLEYDAAAKERFDPIIAGLTRSFRRTEGCGR